MIGHANRILSAQNVFCLRELQKSGVFAGRWNSVLARNMSLLLNKTLIGGNWVSGALNEQLAVLNPATGAVVGHVPDLNADDAQKALKAANDAFYSDEWSQLTAKERSGLLKVSGCFKKKKSTQLKLATTPLYCYYILYF